METTTDTGESHQRTRTGSPDRIPATHGPAATDAGPRRRGDLTRWCAAAAAAGTLVPLALSSFRGSTGDEITASLRAHTVSLQVGSAVAAVVAAGLLVAAMRLARSARERGGDPTWVAVLAAAGGGVAVLYAAYYAAFAAGTVAVAQPGAGTGEATAVLVNVAELTRYAPGLALLVAAWALRAVLPRAAGAVALALALLMLVPVTTWVVALVTPVWLGVAAALAPSPAQNSRDSGSSMPRSAS